MVRSGGEAEPSSSGTTRLRFATPEESEQTLRAPWWQTSEESTIPPPPQVRDEARRHALKQMEFAEREVQNKERYSEYLYERERLKQAHTAAEQELNAATVGTVEEATGTTGKSTSLTHCTTCGSALGEAGKTFSFCLHCGSDVEATPAKAARRTTAQHTFGQAAPSARTTVHTSAQRVSVDSRTETRYTESAPRPAHTVAPGVAGVLSFFLPGLGQIVNGQTAKGVFMLLLYIVLMPVLHVTFLTWVLQGAAAIDAYRIAQRRRDGEMILEDEWDLGRKR